jgi:putative PEP-CTERM system histidine kinase
MEFPGVAVLHGVCGAVYAALTTLLLLRRRASFTGLLLACATSVTAVWAIAVAVSWSEPYSAALEGLALARAVAWFIFIVHLCRRSVLSIRQLTPIFTTIALLALLLMVAMPATEAMAHQIEPVWSVLMGARIGIAVCNILLIENLYRNTPSDLRWHVNLLCIGLGALFLYDLLLYSDAVLFHRVSAVLYAGRASVTVLAAPLIAVAAARNRRWNIDIHVSRTVVFHSATLVASGIFLLALAATGEVFRASGAAWGAVAESTLIFAGLLTVLVFLTSNTMRSRLRVLFVDNFFTHRYDYRHEWARCIATLSAGDQMVGGAFQSRAIRAVADVVDSPGGAIFVRDPDGAVFQWAGSWNVPAVSTAISSDDPVVTAFGAEGRIVQFDDPGAPAPTGADWRGELPFLWLAAPLCHVGQLIGFVALMPPRAPFKLDNEVFSVLRIVGQEVAIQVAERRARLRIAQTKQLEEYGKRFAFVIHDIKNVSGQLSMLLSNAELHADNPEFQRDMLATVRASVTRITNLLGKLQARDHAPATRLVLPIERIRIVAEQVRARYGAVILVEDDGRAASIDIDAASFDAVLLHLIDNAIEASPAGAPILIRLRHEGLSVFVEIVDEGSGMTAEFIRDHLFTPLASTKHDGHGIGVFQARALLREAGGDLTVRSRPSAGTTMRLMLPSAAVPAGDATLISA